MTTIAECNVASLANYVPSDNNPWDEQKVNHLYRRIGFGATRAMINNALLKTPTQVVDEIIDEATTMNPEPAPKWGYWIRDDFYATDIKPFEYRNLLKLQLIDGFFKNNLRDRLTLFWSNHFVTEDNSYQSPAYLFQYYNLLQLHSIGNFKEFTSDIGLCSAMLVYLNGRENTKNKPNENYARELYELFTLGVNNGYSQQDIVETARALTGWNKREKAWSPILFQETKFDKNDKTIFGETGAWGYDDVIRILFDKRKNQIAQFVCTKLYRYFVGPVISQDIVIELAGIFRNNNFEIAPVLRRLFKSEHFFDINSIGIIIKSPADIQVSLFKETGFRLPENFEFYNKIRNGCNTFGQNLFNPVDVAGWQGDTDWVGSSTLVGRWDRMGWYLWKAYQFDKEQFRKFAVDLIGNSTNDVAVISKRIIDHFLSREMTSDTEYAQALEIFKDQVPDNYFEDGTWDLNYFSVPKQVQKLLLHIIRIPEFQLK